MIVVPLSQTGRPEVQARLVREIGNGKVIVYPTDTIYGVGGRADQQSVCQAVDKLKSRPSGQIYSVALSSLDMVQNLAELRDPKKWSLLERLLPGPYTFVVGLRSGIRLPANGFGSNLGIRVPLFPPLTKLISALGIPLITTSINRSGEPPLREPGMIREQFPGIDILIDAGDLPQAAPSTLIDISTDAPCTILRPGSGLDKLVKTLDELNLCWRLGPA